MVGTPLPLHFDFLHLFIFGCNVGGKPPEKTVLDIGSKNASCGPSGRGQWRRVQTGEIFTGDVRCENNDRLATMHTSDHSRLVWYQ